jgi:hypothetical protein
MEPRAPSNPEGGTGVAPRRSEGRARRRRPGHTRRGGGSARTPMMRPNEGTASLCRGARGRRMRSGALGSNTTHDGPRRTRRLMWCGPSRRVRCGVPLWSSHVVSVPLGKRTRGARPQLHLERELLDLREQCVHARERLARPPPTPHIATPPGGSSERHARGSGDARESESSIDANRYARRPARPRCRGAPGARSTADGRTRRTRERARRERAPFPIVIAPRGSRARHTPLDRVPFSRE